MVTSHESSGSPPKRAPPPIPALAPSPIPIMTPSPAPVLASPVSALETSPIPSLAAFPVMSSLSKSVSFNSSRDRELSIDDIDIDDLEEDGDADEVDSLRTSRRKPNDAADLVLGLPPFATGNYGRVH